MKRSKAVYHPAGIYLLKVNNKNTQGVKYVQRTTPSVVLIYLLLTSNIFHILF